MWVILISVDIFKPHLEHANSYEELLGWPINHPARVSTSEGALALEIANVNVDLPIFRFDHWAIRPYKDQKATWFYGEALQREYLLGLTVSIQYFWVRIGCLRVLEQHKVQVYNNKKWSPLYSKGYWLSWVRVQRRAQQPELFSTNVVALESSAKWKLRDKIDPSKSS